MDSNQKYSVFYSGELISGFDLKKSITMLHSDLGLSKDEIRQIMNGGMKQIKLNVDLTTAMEITRKFIFCGLYCFYEPSKVTTHNIKDTQRNKNIIDNKQDTKILDKNIENKSTVEVKISNTESQQATQLSTVDKFYKFGPVVMGIIVPLLTLFTGISSGDANIGAIFRVLFSIITSIPGAYAGLGIAIVAQKIFSGFSVYGSIGYVIQMKLLLFFAPLIGMFIGSFAGMMLMSIILGLFK